MQPQFYYNEHHQVESFINMHSANVSLGEVALAFRLNYKIIENGQTKQSGWARGRQIADENFFIKGIKSDDGDITIDANEVNDIKVSAELYLDYS